MRVALFGGFGYLGNHLHQALCDRDVQCVRLGRRDAGFRDGQLDVLVHLACPRNKPATWDFRRAEQALDQGLATAGRAKVVLISSMSAYDVPDNGYAQFKRMAERVVLGRSGMVLRLPTLLGTTDDVLKYRADLGLHQMAYEEAQGMRPKVHSLAVRHVAPVELIAERIAEHILGNGGGLHELSIGTARFMDIVPHAEIMQPPVELRSYVPVNFSIQPMTLAKLQQSYRHLVERIKDGTATAV